MQAKPNQHDAGEGDTWNIPDRSWIDGGVALGGAVLERLIAEKVLTSTEIFLTGNHLFFVLP